MDAPVVVASIQTLARESRLVRLPRWFETVVVDEAHHATADSVARPTRSRILYVQMVGPRHPHVPEQARLPDRRPGRSHRTPRPTHPPPTPRPRRRDSARGPTGHQAPQRDQAAAAPATPETPLIAEVDLFRESAGEAALGRSRTALGAHDRARVLVVEAYAGAWRVVVREPNTHERRVLADGLDLGYAHGVAEDFIRRLGAAHLSARPALSAATTMAPALPGRRRFRSSAISEMRATRGWN